MRPAVWLAGGSVSRGGLLLQLHAWRGAHMAWAAAPTHLLATSGGILAGRLGWGIQVRASSTTDK